MKPVRWIAGLYVLTIFSMASFAAIKVEVSENEAKLTESTLSFDSGDVKKFYEAVDRRNQAVTKANDDFRKAVAPKPDKKKDTRGEVAKAQAARRTAVKAAEQELEESRNTFVELITKQITGMGTKLKPIVTERKGKFVVQYDKLEGEPRPTIKIELELVPPAADGSTPADVKTNIELSNSKRI